MLAAQKETATNILDLPSGYGRVMRFLKAEFPEAALTACDVIREGVDFCARTFGARAIYGKEDPSELELDERFDLIWCGSLLTHVDEENWGRRFGSGGKPSGESSSSRRMGLPSRRGSARGGFCGE